MSSLEGRTANVARLCSLMVDLDQASEVAVAMIGSALLLQVRMDGEFKPDTLRLTDAFACDAKRRAANAQAIRLPNSAATAAKN